MKSLSHVRLFVTPWAITTRLLRPFDLQARILEWIAISFSRGSSRLRDRTRVSILPTGGKKGKGQQFQEHTYEIFSEKDRLPVKMRLEVCIW